MIRYVSDLDDPAKLRQDPDALQMVRNYGVDFVKRILREHGYPEAPRKQDRSPEAGSTVDNRPIQPE